VFGGVRSLPITNIQRELEKGIAASGVKPIRLHDLRHSHASNLIAEGVPIIAVSKRLGHASITITLDTYAHLLERTEDEMMATINAFRQKEKASPMGIETRPDIRKAL
jgi:integrase